MDNRKYSTEVIYSNTLLMAIEQVYYWAPCSGALQQLSIHSNISHRLRIHMYLESFSVHLVCSSSPVLATMCGPDCDDVMDDVSNSH